MALLWVIADLIGNGGSYDPKVANWQEATGPIRPVVHGLGSYRCLIANGIPWALVLTDADPALLALESRCTVLPDERLDTVLTSPRANQVNNALARRGLPEVAAAGMTYREVIEELAHIIQPDFNVGWYPGVT